LELFFFLLTAGAEERFKRCGRLVDVNVTAALIWKAMIIDEAHVCAAEVAGVPEDGVAEFAPGSC